MKSNREGQAVPQVTFKTRQNDQWVDVTTDELFKDKTVVESFGEDADEYQNYWGSGPKY